MRIEAVMAGVTPKATGGISTLVKMVVQNAPEHEIDIDYVTTANQYVANPSFFTKMKKIAVFMVGIVRILFLLCVRGKKILHLHMANNASLDRSFILSRIAVRCGACIVLQIHCDLAYFYSVASKKRKRKIDYILTHSDAIIVLGSYLNNFLADSGIENNRIELLPNAVDTPLSNPYGKRIKGHILYLGNICPEKGLNDLLRALTLASPYLPNGVYVDLCGRDLMDIEKRIAEMGLGSIVRYRGTVVVNAGFFEDYILNILPSHNEALPFSLLEASAQGVPSVATRVGAVSDVIADEISGVLVDAGDALAISNALIRLTTDAEARCRMSSNIYATVCERYSSQNYLLGLKNIYEKACMRKDYKNKNEHGLD